MTAIGPHQLRNPVLLAPMAGITDAPFRSVAWDAGVGYVASEIVASQARLWDTDKSRLRREWVPGIEPRVVQLAGSEPVEVADAARRHWLAGAQIIDINFGCPAKKVCRRAAGSQLMREPERVAAIAAAAVRAVPIPVTVKMRTGWSPSERNAVAVARRLEDAGVAAITVHGRSRCCFFAGEAEYDTIAEVKAGVGLPVFANGDIDSPAKALRVLRHTGADGVMVGRAALGAPWLLGQIADPSRPAPQPAERVRIMQAHVRALHAFYGEPGVRIARKHVQWYVEKLAADPDAQHLFATAELSSALARAFNQLTDTEAQLDFLAAFADAAADCTGALAA
ncbi:MAG: tRNA dihydrouridine synthase DusB [Gammaproteobacteria bacterium]